MSEIRIRPRDNRGSSVTLGVAFLLIAFGALKIAEAVLDRSFEGGGQIIIGAALLLPSAISMSRGGRPYFWLTIIGLCVIAAGILNLITFNIPWFAVLLVMAGLWILFKSRGDDSGYEVES